MWFVIRDDDTNYHTDPADLSAAFGDIWNLAPVTVAAIPRVSPRADVALPADVQQARPIRQNKSLTRFLRDHLEAGHLEIALHGYDHQPYDGGPEFVRGPALYDRVRRGTALLEAAFDTTVSVFVPPHVRLSNRGLRAVASANLDIVRGLAPLPREFQPTVQYPFSYARLAWFLLTNDSTVRYPYPLDFGSHREMYSHRLSDDTPLSTLLEGVDDVARRDGVFCLSTHSSYLSERGRDKLAAVVDYASQYDPEYGTASEAFAYFS